jgi:enoyl-CoA hydratase
MQDNVLIVEKKDQFCILTINRPDALNALNKDVFDELNSFFSKHYKDYTIKGVVITGSGSKAFVAGADIKEFSTLNQEEGKKLSKKGQDILFKIERFHAPVIAAVNGFALGGGCELAMACHLRIASENAKFGQPEVKLGLIPGYGGTQRLVQLIGKGKALELLMTADTIDAHQAHVLGLANQVVQTVELLDSAKAMINKIAQQAPVAIANVIACVQAHFTDGIDGFNTEVDLFGACVATEDFTEGTSAFLEKRKPSFKGK